MKVSLPALVACSAVFLSALAHAQVGKKQRIDNFLIDRTEVTIGQFRRFALAKGFVSAAEREGGGFEWAGGWVRRDGWNVYRPFGTAPDSDDEPAVHLNWAEADAYCRWAGGRLPAVQEWQSAAYNEQRLDPPAPYKTGQRYDFPTGDSPEGANTSAPDRWPRMAPAGQTLAGVNGLFDMGGNVWEWVADGEGGERRTMGGSWWYDAPQTRADVVASKPASFYAVYVGFRCAYDAPA